MSVDHVDVLLLLTIQNLIPHSEAQYREWLGGDWAMDSLHFTNEPIDNTAEWAEYLHTLGDDYEEFPNMETTKKEFVAPDENVLRRDPPDWHPLAPNEDPYLAVIYRRDIGASGQYITYFPNEPDPGGSHVSPGTACGGALLSPRHVLTACGCVLTLVIDRVPGVRNPFQTPGYPAYDIYDREVRGVTPIYVTHAVTKFAPDFKHVIDRSGKWSGFESLNCKATLDQLQRRYAMDYEDARKEAMINGQPIIMPFTPDIRQDFIRFFPRWPPLTINLRTDAALQKRVELISIGMRLTKPGRRQLFSSISPSSTALKHCRVRSFVCNTTRVHLGVTHTCYCPIEPGIQKLVGGVIGWPILHMGYLVGITGSERHPTDGTVMATVMHPLLIRRIEDYVTKKVLEDQNTPPPQFRERELGNRYFIYDYGELRRRTRNRPFAKATSNYSTALTFSLTIISWLTY